MDSPISPSPGAAVWVVETIVATDVLFPDGVSLPRPAFLETAWELLEDTGLLGIHEGTIDVADAFAAGLTDSTLVIDEAEAPPRDWVGARDLADVEFWFPSAEGAREAAARLVRLLGCALVGIRREAPRDWAAESRAAIGPVAVPRFGRIVPPWHADGDGAGGRGLDDPGITVVIDPGAGFGTGIHPTTRLCLSALADSAPGFRGGSVLDFGSGSGILAIAAALLGATVTDAVEIDGRVHEAITGNARLNGVSERVVVHSALPVDGHTRHDLVVANIVAAVLLSHAEALVRGVRAGGTLVLSGLLADDIDGVRTRYEALGAPRPSAIGEDGWWALVFSFRTADA